MNPQQLWNAVLGELELLLSKANFTTWFKNTSVSSINEDEATIAVPNGFTKAWLEKKYHNAILKAIKNVTDDKINKVTYKIEAGVQSKSPIFSKYENISDNSSADSQKTKSSNKKERVDSFGLNPKYTFNNFIVGKNNELAHAASLAVSKTPGQAYNPLFIYGGVGLGKTHLQQAIGHKIKEMDDNINILYVSCEKFTNEYINSIQSGQANNFTKKYRSVDLLLIDDIQFISGKERTQEAFFHTFNELHQQNKQIVLTSDRPPKAISQLEHRLLSRFEWGMIADISSPDFETKIAIINSKAREKNYPLSREIAEYLATNIQNNIRELEGALNRIIAHSQLKNKEFSLDEIKEITDSIITNTHKKMLTPKNIITTVAEYYDIETDDIIGKCRKKDLALPRQIIMYIMREEMKASYPTIGYELGDRDHTTAMHAYNKIVKNLQSDDKLRQDINILRQKLSLG